MDENILKLKKLVSESSNIVFFGGAGVSTESGIPDFRSEQGIYNTVKNLVILLSKFYRIHFL